MKNKLSKVSNKKYPRYFIIKKSRPDLQRQFSKFQYYADYGNGKWFAKKSKDSEWRQDCALTEAWSKNTLESEEVSAEELALMF
jgi:hypothetical protein